MKKFTSLVASVSLFSPMLAFAAGPTFTYLTSFLDSIKDILNSIIPIMITLAIVVFFYELVMFIKTKTNGDEKAMETARTGLIWALVAIFIMLSFMGVVRILQGITGTSGGNVITNADIPQITI